MEENYPPNYLGIIQEAAGRLVPSHEMAIGYTGRKKIIEDSFIKLIEIYSQKKCNLIYNFTC